MTNLPNPFGAGAPSSQAPSAEIPDSIQRLLAEIENDHRFVLDAEAFMAAIEPMPLFLQRIG